LLQYFIKDKNIAEKPIKEIMGKPYPIVKKMTTLEDVSKLITNENDAVIIDLENGNHHIITKYDIISAI
jgi:cystathionine beta-synthase